MSAAFLSVPVASNPEIEAERRRAVRALLQNPLLSATGETAKEYSLVRRHATWLKYWFAKFADWQIHLDKDVARLHKTPPDPMDETRPAVDGTSGSAFSRRRYALLCLALAALEKSEQQTTLGKVAGVIAEFVAADQDLQAAGLVFDISNHDQRRDLIHVVRLLIEIGLLRRIAGDEQQFLNRTGASDALYEIHRPILAVMNIGGAPARQTAPTAVRARLVRALLDDPVLYFEELTVEERSYLERHRTYLLQQIREATGLVPEIRREGIAMVDDAGSLTDLRLPEEGTDGHVALLLAAFLSEQLRNNRNVVVPFSAVEEHVRHLIQIHGSRWRKAVTGAGAETQLAEDTLWRLRALRLVRITANGLVPLPAIARYGVNS